MKMLGKIFVQSLKTRLKQMWVRNGEINIVDLSNDYYFVTFSNKEYQDRAILEEMWSLNFNMKINVISTSGGLGSIFKIINKTL